MARLLFGFTRCNFVKECQEAMRVGVDCANASSPLQCLCKLDFRWLCPQDPQPLKLWNLRVLRQSAWRSFGAAIAICRRMCLVLDDESVVITCSLQPRFLLLNGIRKTRHRQLDILSRQSKILHNFLPWAVLANVTYYVLNADCVTHFWRWRRWNSSLGPYDIQFTFRVYHPATRLCC